MDLDTNHCASENSADEWDHLVTIAPTEHSTFTPEPEVLIEEEMPARSWDPGDFARQYDGTCKSRRTRHSIPSFRSRPVPQGICVRS
jgi:hypothetical protein